MRNKRNVSKLTAGLPPPTSLGELYHPEIAAMIGVERALKPLDVDMRANVLEWAFRSLAGRTIGSSIQVTPRNAHGDGDPVDIVRAAIEAAGGTIHMRELRKEVQLTGWVLRRILKDDLKCRQLSRGIWALPGRAAAPEGGAS